jgi:Polyketide cyclase / dehydrase and lipid transport
VAVGPLRFGEEITAFERPTRMDYLIEEINVPFEHEVGRITLTESEGGTEAVWTSTFRVPVRLIGGPAETLLWVPALKRGFRRILEDTDRLLAG